ncbi:DUF1501 domain-containing protein [Salinibius halmophilus]|uniref:DUF1501 domain-containing protein n=1 Tax=Salinibius halmophilus TaxID=1853216 RepID=UPI000E6626DC|nr:DUF1501 domain-containing protein [Salinibius halmophilus]
MNRRDFLKALAASGMVAATPVVPTLARANSIPLHQGDIFISIEARGGWDVTSFCDPKASTTINNWAATDSVQTVANSQITYAPFANNAKLFTNHSDKMLVINGIDSQTNAHDAGRIHNWSGQFRPGYPATSALYAAVMGRQLPFAFVSNGGFRETAGLVPYTLMSNPSQLLGLVNTNRPTNSGFSRVVPDEQLDLLKQAKMARLERLQQVSELLPGTRKVVNDYVDARTSQAQISVLEDYLPSESLPIDHFGYRSSKPRQIQLTLAACQAGLCVAADLSVGGFDTHSNHDERHSECLTELVDTIDFLWQEAEARGLADRLKVLVSSEFSRTPKYNDGNGKDHWPINSALLMQKNASFAGQVVGASNEKHEALTLNPDLSVANEGEGERITPADVHKLVRHWLAIENNQTAVGFNLASNVDLTSLLS